MFLRVINVGLVFAFAVTGAHAATLLADLVLRNGTVLTADMQDDVAQAIAIRDGRIVAVGSNHAVSTFIGKRTKLIDLAGRTATPGLIDTHAHLLEGGLNELYNVDLTHATRMAELLAKVRARADASAQGAWVYGAGWNEGLLEEHRAPSLSELDSVSGGHPVVLRSTTGHYVVANSAALALAQIDATTPNPAAGTIDRDANGHLTGLLKESASWLPAFLPHPTGVERQTAIRGMIEQMHSEGMTGVKDPSQDADGWAAYLDLAKSGGLSVHVCALIRAGATMASATKALAMVHEAKQHLANLPGSDLAVCGVKILLDGALLARTAWMSADYAVNPQHPESPGRGYPTVEPSVYREMVTLFNHAGVSIGTHAIGDRAIDLAVDTYAQALQDTAQVGLRHSVIHASLPTDHALAVMKDLQTRYDAAIPEVQAEFLWWLGDALPGLLGPERSQHMKPLATFEKLGLIFAGGSDYPVTPIAARYGIWASVARAPLKGVYGPRPFGMSEAINVHTALKTYTIWAARQLFLEKETGSLETGKWADIAIWDRNPYKVATAAIKDMQCKMTLYKGKVVFERAAKDAGRSD